MDRVRGVYLAWVVPGRGGAETVDVCGAPVLRCPMPDGADGFARWRRQRRFRRMVRAGVRQTAVPEPWRAEARRWGLHPVAPWPLRRMVLLRELENRRGDVACIRAPRPSRAAEEATLILARHFRYLRLDIPRCDVLQETLLRRFGVSGAAAGQPELTVSFGGPPRCDGELCLGEDCCAWQAAEYLPPPGWEGETLPEDLLCALWSGGYLKKENIRLKMLIPRA